MTGLPVVATGVSGIPELVLEDGVTGLLAPQRDAGGLADALQRVHGDPALARRLAAHGRAHVLERFNLLESVARLRDQLAAALTDQRQASRVARVVPGSPGGHDVPLRPGDRPARPAWRDERRSPPLRAPAILRLRVTAERDEARGAEAVVGAKLARDLVPIHVRQPDVAQDDLGLQLMGLPDPRQAVGGHVHPVALQRQHLREGLGRVDVVVDDEDVDGPVPGSRGAWGACRGGLGRQGEANDELGPPTRPRSSPRRFRRAAPRCPSPGRGRGRGPLRSAPGSGRPGRTARRRAAAAPGRSRCRCRERRSRPARSAAARRVTLPPPRRELGGVLQQVPDHLRDARRVGVDPDFGPELVSTRSSMPRLRHQRPEVVARRQTTSRRSTPCRSSSIFPRAMRVTSRRSSTSRVRCSV